MISNARGHRRLIWVGFWSCVGICGACTHSPSQPSKTIPPVTGTWSGAYRVTTCSATFAVLPCSYFVPSTNAMRLVLTQDGENVSGTFTSDIIVDPVAVTGSIGIDRILHLQGAKEFQPPICGTPLLLKLEIADWTTGLATTRNYAQQPPTAPGQASAPSAPATPSANATPDPTSPLASRRSSCIPPSASWRSSSC